MFHSSFPSSYHQPTGTGNFLHLLPPQTAALGTVGEAKGNCHCQSLTLGCPMPEICHQTRLKQQHIPTYHSAPCSSGPPFRLLSTASPSPTITHNNQSASTSLVLVGREGRRGNTPDNSLTQTHAECCEGGRDSNDSVLATGSKPKWSTASGSELASSAPVSKSRVRAQL